MKNAAHWEAVQRCTLATFGDGLIIVLAFWCVAAFTRSRYWMLDPSAYALAGFVAVGVAVTILLEKLNTEYLHRWEYASIDADRACSRHRSCAAHAMDHPTAARCLVRSSSAELTATSPARPGKRRADHAAYPLSSPRLRLRRREGIEDRTRILGAGLAGICHFAKRLLEILQTRDLLLNLREIAQGDLFRLPATR